MHYTPTAKELVEHVMLGEKTISNGDEVLVAPTTEDIIKIKSSVDKIQGNIKWKERTPFDQPEDPTPYLPVVLSDSRTSTMTTKMDFGTISSKSDSIEEPSCHS